MVLLATTAGNPSGGFGPLFFLKGSSLEFHTQG